MDKSKRSPVPVVWSVVLPCDFIRAHSQDCGYHSFTFQIPVPLSKFESSFATNGKDIFLETIFAELQP